MKERFKPTEIAGFFNVSRTTVVNWINLGKLPAYETLGGHYRVNRKDLLKFSSKKGLPLPEELKTSQYRILIVDDEKSVIDSVKGMIEDMGIDAETREATNGVIAGIELSNFKPNLVILDAMMPGADGDIVVRAIKEKKEFNDVKILVYTGYPEEGQKLLETGADELVIKASSDDNMDNFQKKVLKILGIKYRQVVPAT